MTIRESRRKAIKKYVKAKNDDPSTAVNPPPGVRKPFRFVYFDDVIGSRGYREDQKRPRNTQIGTPSGKGVLTIHRFTEIQ